MKMKKILFAAALIGFAFADSVAQTPPAVSTVKDEPVPQTAEPANTAVKPSLADTAKPAAKPAPRVAPASIRQGEPVKPREGTGGKKRTRKIKDNTAPVKPIAPVEDNKK